jgi:hypothetical protein
MLFVVGISNRGEELSIAVTAADILRRTRVRAIAAMDQRGEGLRVWRSFFNSDHVVPVIAEIIDIVKAASIDSERFIQGDATFVAMIKFRGIVRVGVAVGDAGDYKLMKMAVVQPRAICRI